jgi:hypothetical protein
MNAPFPLAREIAVPASREDASSARLHIAGIIGLAVIARAIFWTVRPPDMAIFLEPWFAHIVQFGPVGAFAHPFSNYEPAYLYLLALGSLAAGLLTPMTIIKIISVGGTLFLTLAFADLLKAARVARRNALLVLVLPTIAFNDALLAQCDALWAGACILALAGMMRGRTLSAMAWCGVAFAFKAQAAFIAPVIIGAMIGRRAPWWQWLVPGLVFLATLIPPWLMGWPGLKLLTVYLDQAAWDRIPGRLANPWMVGTIFADHASRDWFALGYAATGAAAVVITALAARAARNPRVLILLAALAGTALPFLLPKMLERYYFLGDVMTLALVLSLRSRPAVYAMCAVQIASILSHVTLMYFYYQPYPALVGALFAAGGLAIMCRLAAPQFKSLVRDVRSRFASCTPFAALKAS